MSTKAVARSAPSGERDRQERDRDPLAAVLGLGDRASNTGGTVALLLALISHGAFSVQAMSSLLPMKHVVEKMRAEQHDFFWTMYDIEVPAPEKKPDEPPPPKAEPVAEAEPRPVVSNTPKAAAKAEPDEPPPPPSQAAKVMTAPEKQDEPLDLTGQGFVSGDGSGAGYGMVSTVGTGTAPTWNQGAKNGGVPGGTGTGTKPSAPPPAVEGPDRSAPPGLVGGASWNCPFPPEADTDQIDQAVATILVTVRPDGSPLAVKVMSDPGHGFGRAARTCALSRRFTPALDRNGEPTSGTTPPIKVRFTR